MYGGKANSLLRLEKSGFNVPRFFIISKEDYRQFLEENDILTKIDQMVKNKDYANLEKAIMGGNLNDRLVQKIKDGLSILDCKMVSVRSSASNEDSKNKSYAGQYDSFLNVSTEDIEEYLKRCWLSLYNDNISAYSNIDDLTGMNVIIQKMINSEYSGVAFSLDPTSKTGNYSLIEVTSGLGENLVSGKVTPTKYLVRRKTTRIDLKIGDSKIEESTITELEKTILKIEEEFACPVDVEFAIESKTIYILQTRPITTESTSLVPFVLTITRPMSILEIEIYSRGEYEGIKKITRDLHYFKPMFAYNPKNNNVDIYYNGLDLEEDPRLMFHYIDEDYFKIEEYLENVVKKNIKDINEVLDQNAELELSTLIDKIISIYPFISLGQLAGHFDKMTPRVKELMVTFRNNYDYIIHEALEYVLQNLKKKLTKEYIKYLNFLTLHDIENALPTISTLAERSRGYIYFDGLIETQDYENWFSQNGIIVETENENTSLKGDVAYPAQARGKVCIIYSEADFPKFEEGDILVTPMTVPKFTEIIAKASGIITDEGGITCHASIIAREMHIPCLVGCKNATKLLKDGDLVEIDGATGNITIIKENDL